TVVGYLLLGLLAKPSSLGKANIFISVAAIILAPLNCLMVLFIPEATFEIALVCWGMVALGQVAMTALWSQRLAAFKHEEALAIAAGSFIIAGILIIFVSFLQEIPSIVATILLPLLSLLMFWLQDRALSRKVVTSKSKSSSSVNKASESTAGHDTKMNVFGSKRSAQIQRRSIFMLVYCTALGFAGCYATAENLQVYSVLIIGFSGSLAGALIYYASQRVKIDLTRLLMSLFLPVAIICMFPLIFMVTGGKLFFLAILFFFFHAFDIIGLSAIPAETEGRKFLIKNCAKGRIWSAVGSTIGWGLGCISLYGTDSGGVLTSFIYFVFCAAFAIVNVLIIQRPVLANPSSSVEKQMIFPALNDLDEHDYHLKMGVNGIEDKQGHWKTKCDLIAQEIDLSARQREVFFLLAKGRNAKHIQDTLYISSSTVKSHVYSIYRKMDVHSQQELIDKVEKFVIE
ncbi:MAG: helix-turn-helix transcriptional regulator, partial [Actinobacteria bacterium]|nr:helix-turn-helix transcriptional regulator [Actinomycetota bacterium]